MKVHVVEFCNKSPTIDQKELHAAYIKKPNREHGSPSTMPVEPLRRANRSIHKLTESPAQLWGMNIHRYYLLGIPFDSYTDHQPLIHIYNGNKKGNAHVKRHRLKVQDFPVHHEIHARQDQSM